MFDDLLAKGESARRARDFEACAASFEKAVSLYRGEFMKGGYDDWMEEQRSYYGEQYLRMLETLADIAQRGADWTQSLQLAQKILREDEFREDIHCRVMRAHAACGVVQDRDRVLRRGDRSVVLDDQARPALAMNRRWQPVARNAPNSTTLCVAY